MDDYDAARLHFQRAYENLFDLLGNYPEELREQAGACGDWSPRETLAHLSGWIAEAHVRYSDFAAGDESDIEYGDVDVVNAASVAARRFQDWNATVLELRGLVQDMLSRSEAVLPRITANDHRYGEWLHALAADCEDHHEQLYQFAESRV